MRKAYYTKKTLYEKIEQLYHKNDGLKMLNEVGFVLRDLEELDRPINYEGLNNIESLGTELRAR
jgi:uncharacterized lipoprotein YehR (DUF1307 family)